MSIPSDLEPDDVPNISPDFLQGDIHKGLEALRKRLLDLSGRNRLLNYRYTKKSSLRVVDELPNQLFEQLVDGKELFFKPVPQPRRAEYPPPLEAPAADDYARKLGIRTSFELPTAVDVRGASDSRYADREIQTLHYAEDLEAILRAMSSAARLAIEETGTNMLYLVFGFLEWFESEASQQPRQAPLLLLPVTLRRAEADPRTGAIRYAVQYSGEDIGSNLTLQERLKRDFDLELPPLSEDESPESYWQSISPILHRDERWKIRRNVTLSLLSFGKLLLYRDLDPATWPKGQSPAEHPRINEFFQGIQRAGISFAEDYRLDEPPVSAKVPLIVDEADSSQHSALVDAVAGSNLVIEGPPGTGKSQTICNLIAAAIHGGKSVLFVSEKLAALEVVRHRLDAAGLGQFCLELHSHKTQKRRLLDDVSSRLNNRTSASHPEELRDRLLHAESHKKLLSEYSTLMNSRFGASRRTLYELMWSAQRKRRGLSCDLDALAEIQVPNPEQLSPEKIDELRQLVDRFATHLGEVTAQAPLRQHAWYGLENSALTFMDERAVVQGLTKVREAADSLRSAVHHQNAALGVEWVQPTLDGITRIIRDLKTLPQFSPRILAPALGRLRDPSVQRRVREFLSLVSRLESLEQELRDIAGGIPEISTANLQRAAVLLAEAERLAPGTERVDEYAQRGRALGECGASIIDALAAFQSCAAICPPQTRADLAALDATQAALKSLQHVQPGDLRHRQPGLREADAAAVLEVHARLASAIREKRDKLNQLVELDAFEDFKALRESLSIAANAGFFAFLSPGYRRIRSQLIAAMRTPTRVRRRFVHETYRQIVDVIAATRRFDESADARRICGESFRGIETPFDALQRLVNWRRLISVALASFGELGAKYLDAAWSAQSDEITRLQGLEVSNSALSHRLMTATSAVASANAIRGTAVATGRALLEVSDEILRAGDNLSAASAEIERTGFPCTVRVADAGRVVRLIAETDALRAQINSARDIHQLLGDDFTGAGSHRDAVLETLRFIERVNASSVSAVVKDWVLHPLVEERLSSLSSFGTSSATNMNLCADSWEAFNALGKIELSEWLGQGFVKSASFNQLVERADVALTARESLAAWLDYLRSRDALRSGGLAQLAHMAITSSLAINEIVAAFDFVANNAVVRCAIRANPHLARFSGLSHSQVRKRFQDLDLEVLHLSRKAVAAAAAQRPVPAGNGYGAVSSYTELHLLEREVEKQRRHIPLRQLVRRAGGALQALKPCFMMGPMSVAQYLTPGALKFDLVIMDEASQLKPEDALGSIARGSQVVIVGDSMQLPPTSFFDRLGDDDDDASEETGAEALTESESILDVAAAVHKPTRLLRWHYRSRHGSLIAFSNKEFYKGELIVYPSPEATTPLLGVKHIHVGDGLYENRRNIPEAQRIVDTAIRHMSTRPKESLGIVTMNSTQRELVEDLFESRLKRDPDAERYLASRQNSLEPFFIKNLENVQGDERDVIYISTTYGRNAGGQVFQRFGPINGAAGHRRLNVLYTRARRRTVVFASMTSADIIVQPNSSRGVKALKGYLHFAETGIIENARFSGRQPDSDFEIEVAEALGERGLEVVAQVGVAGYFIDLAVKHPGKSDAFVLGIECDGATYHSSKSARDRDRLREKVLNGLEWKLHRIWSTDWFKQPAIETERVVARVQEILAAEPEVFSETEAEIEIIDDFAPPTWAGEQALQPLSEEEAREALLVIRSELAERGTSLVAKPLLRDEMLTVLLRTRPRTRDDFLRRVPMELRLETDGDELQTHLGRVLEVTARLRQ